MKLQKALQENYLAAFISRFASSQILILSQYVRPMFIALKRIQVIKMSKCKTPLFHTSGEAEIVCVVVFPTEG